MRKKVGLTIAGLLALISVLSAIVHAFQSSPAPYIELNPTYECTHGDRIIIQPRTNGKTVRWILPDAIQNQVLPDYGNKLVITAHADGTHTLFAYTALGDTPTEPARCVLIINPEKPGPVPPTPDPPGPTPGPSPIPAPGLHVLIVIDETNAKAMAPEQYAALSSQSFLQGLSAKCPKLDGGNGWRVYPKSQTALAPVWKAAMDKALASGVPFPILVVSNSPKGGEIRSLPPTAAEINAAIAKWEK